MCSFVLPSSLNELDFWIVPTGLGCLKLVHCLGGMDLRIREAGRVISQVGFPCIARIGKCPGHN